MAASFSYPVGQAPATQTNDSAAAGKVGELISSNVVAGSAVALTTGVVANVTSISLTPGDWDVEGMIAFTATATTNITVLSGSVSGVSATVPTAPNNTSPLGGGGMNLIRFPAFVPATTNLGQLPTGAVRVTLSATTTIYLVAFCAFTVSTLTAYGYLGARRVR